MYNIKRNYSGFFPVISLYGWQSFRDHEAMLAYKALNTRYYAGRMVQCEFVDIPSWSAAICGKDFD